jgi:lipopolysaccharide transport protein LptA
MTALSCLDSTLSLSKRFMSKITHYCQIVLFVAMTFPCSAASLSEHSIETVNISADEAYEALEPGTLHFKGHFVLLSSDWRLEADEAMVAGRPDLPDIVLLEGSPARFLIDREGNEKQHSITASAPSVEYRRSSNSLQLSGGAELNLDGEIIKSEAIDFDIETERYRAHGSEGVKMKVPAFKR